MGDPKGTHGYTKPWSNDLDDLGVPPHDLGNFHFYDERLLI